MNNIKAVFQPVLTQFKEKVVDTELHAYAANVCTEAKITVDAIGAKLPDSKTLKVAAGTLSFTAVLDVPFSLYELGKGIKNLATSKTKDERIDHSLTIAATVSQLADDAMAIGSGLSELKVVTSAMRWIPPLTVVSAVLSTANFAIEGRNLYYSDKMLAKMKKAKYVNDPAALAKKHAYRMETYCGVDPKLVKETLAKKPDAFDACKEEILRRMKFRKVTQALNIVIAVITLIATALLLASPLAPIAIAATVLFALTAALSMTRRGMNFYAERSFKKRMTALAA